MTITIMSIDIFNIRHVKDLNIYDSLSTFFDNQLPYQDTQDKKHMHSEDQEVSSDEFEQFKQKNAWLFPQSMKDLQKVDLKFVINDNCDVCIRIRENPEKQEHEHHQRSSLDYRSRTNLKKTLEKEEQQESEPNEESDDDHDHDQ